MPIRRARQGFNSGIDHRAALEPSSLKASRPVPACITALGRVHLLHAAGHSTLQATLRTKPGEIEQTIIAFRSLYNELHTLLKRLENCSGRKSDE